MRSNRFWVSSLTGSTNKFETVESADRSSGRPITENYLITTIGAHNQRLIRSLRPSVVAQKHRPIQNLGTFGTKEIQIKRTELLALNWPLHIVQWTSISLRSARSSGVLHGNDHSRIKEHCLFGLQILWNTEIKNKSDSDREALSDNFCRSHDCMLRSEMI